jgi:hypothetical protein
LRKVNATREKQMPKQVEIEPATFVKVRFRGGTTARDIVKAVALGAMVTDVTPEGQPGYPVYEAVLDEAVAGATQTYLHYATGRDLEILGEWGENGGE